MKNKLVLLLLIIAIGISFISCGKEDAKTASPKDLILGNWVLDDVIKKGNSIISSEQREKLSKDIENGVQPVYIYEKDKIRVKMMGEWHVSNYIWLDDKKIEVTNKDGTKTNKVEVTAEKLILSEVSNATEDNKQIVVFKRYKGAVPQ